MTPLSAQLELAPMSDEAPLRPQCKRPMLASLGTGSLGLSRHRQADPLLGGPGFPMRFAR